MEECAEEGKIATKASTQSRELVRSGQKRPSVSAFGAVNASAQKLYGATAIADTDYDAWKASAEFAQDESPAP